MVGYALNFLDTFLVSLGVSLPIFVAIGGRERYLISICLKKIVLAEISAKKPSYSRHARLTVDGALPT